MKRIFLAITSLSLIIFCNQTAEAQKDPCEADWRKFCPNYAPKDPFRLFCLKNLESQISASCKATLRDVSPDAGASIAICSDDVAKLCAGVAPGDSRILKCLKANTKKLDFECRKKVVVFPNPR